MAQYNRSGFDRKGREGCFWVLLKLPLKLCLIIFKGLEIVNRRLSIIEDELPSTLLLVLRAYCSWMLVISGARILFYNDADAHFGIAVAIFILHALCALNCVLGYILRFSMVIAASCILAYQIGLGGSVYPADTIKESVILVIFPVTWLIMFGPGGVSLDARRSHNPSHKR